MEAVGRPVSTAEAVLRVTTVKVSFDRLFIMDVERKLRRGLFELTDPDDHIHGVLAIDVDGRRLPHLGFFGPDDVCIGDWAVQLRRALRSLRESAGSRYVYDEHEQGQPAFLFEREGTDLFVSVVAAVYSGGGKADPDWQRVPCRFADFERSVESFIAELRDHILREAPVVAEEWWRLHIEEQKYA